MSFSQTRPLLAFLLLAASLITSRAAYGQAAQGTDLGLRVVCIDPGHGGKDSGCISRDGRTMEKTIVLSIGRKLRDKISAAYPDVKVVMTRSDDSFIALSDRADIANRAGAGLFVSIHINAVEKGSSANGFSIHTLGQSSVKGRDLFENNMDLCKRENSVVLLEDDYTTTYQGFNPDDPESSILFNLMQNANLEQSLVFAEDVDKEMTKGPIRNNRGISQDPFLVLWKTTMPAVLIECAFMTNETDLAAIRSESGREMIAERIFQAFSNFKRRYDSSFGIVYSDVPAPKPDDSSKEIVSKGKTTTKQVTTTPTSKGTSRYGTQVLASAKNMDLNDSFFKGNKVEKIPYGKLYKYVIGVDTDLEAARKKYRSLKKDFPDCFLIEIRPDGSVSAVK